MTHEHVETTEPTPPAQAAEQEAAPCSRKHALVRTLKRLAAYDESREFIPLKFSNLLWIFILASFAGLIIETLVSWPIDGELRRRYGMLLSPLSPIYGVGALLITIALNGLKRLPNFALFLVAGAVGATFEYVAGWFWEAYFGIVAWSYEGQPLNIGGHTSGVMVVCWGILGLVWVKGALPLIMRFLDRASFLRNRAAVAVITTILVLDGIMTFTTINCWYERLAGNVPETPVELVCAQLFPDDVMQNRFGVMSMHPELASER